MVSQLGYVTMVGNPASIYKLGYYPSQSYNFIKQE